MHTRVYTITHTYVYTHVLTHSDMYDIDRHTHTNTYLHN